MLLWDGSEGAEGGGEQFLLTLRDWSKAGVAAGFSSRLGGVSAPPFDSKNLGFHVADDPAAVVANRRRVAEEIGIPLERFIYAEQVHGNAVAVVTGEDAGRGAWVQDQAIAGVDALVTAEKGLVLAVQTADCVPVLLADSDAGVIGAVHAGWRGATAGVVPAAVERMVSLGARPGRMRAALGPSVRGCCYEVDTPVIRAVRAEYDRMDMTRSLALKPLRRRMGRALLDIPALCRDQLLHLGLPSRYIIDTAVCTSCMPGYFSHRRDRGKTGRQGGFVALL